MHLLYIMFVLAAVSLSCVRAFTTQHTLYNTLLYLLTHAAWPPLLWLITMVAFWTPIHYALFPPNMPDREELLDRNPKTGVAHPKPEWKAQRWNAFSWFYEMQYTLLTAFTCLIFVASFLIADSVQLVVTPNAPTPTGPVQLCGQYQSVNTPNGLYTIGTNQWGMDSSGAQCLSYDPNDNSTLSSPNATSFSTTWSWLESQYNVSRLG